MLTERENLLRVVRFERPDYIPMGFHVSEACWNHYPQEALIEVMAAHPFLFPGFEPPSMPVQLEYAPWRSAGSAYVDSWECTWQTLVGWMGYPEDLGMQVGPMISPRCFRAYIQPTYQRLMAPAREAGCIVHMHSDGDIRALVDDLFVGGVEVIKRRED